MVCGLHVRIMLPNGADLTFFAEQIAEDHAVPQKQVAPQRTIILKPYGICPCGKKCAHRATGSAVHHQPRLQGHGGFIQTMPLYCRFGLSSRW